MNELTPPHDTYVESGLIGGLIIDPTQIDRLGDTITEHDFYDEGLGQLFGAIKVLHESGKNISDPGALIFELERFGLPSEVTSRSFIFKLCQDGPAYTSTVPQYAIKLSSLATLRRQLRVSMDLQKRISEKGADPIEIGSWLESQLMSMGSRVAESAKDIGTVARSIASSLRTPRVEGPGVMIGIPSHDKLVGGYQAGEFIIGAARANVGKTALAATAAENVSANGKGVLYVSLEMTEDEIAKRILCGRSGVDSRRLRTGNIQESHIRAIEHEAEAVSGLPLSIWAPHSASLAQIRAMAKQTQVAEGLDLLIIDYVGLIKPADHKQPRHEQVSVISRGLKELAKELRIPILALAQLNRDAESEPPKLSQLRDSGSLEQDADIVLLLHRIRGETNATLIIAKHRHGEIGDIPLRWNPVRMAYEDLAVDEFDAHQQQTISDWNQPQNGGFYAD